MGSILIELHSFLPNWKSQAVKQHLDDHVGAELETSPVYASTEHVVTCTIHMLPQPAVRQHESTCARFITCTHAHMHIRRRMLVYTYAHILVYTNLLRISCVQHVLLVFHAHIHAWVCVYIYIYTHILHIHHNYTCTHGHAHAILNNTLMM